MKLLLFMARSARLRLAAAMSSSLLSGVAGVAAVAVLNHSLFTSLADLPKLGAAFALLSLLTVGLRWLSQSQFAELGEQALATLRSLVSRQVAHAPYSDLEREGQSRMFGVLTADIALVADYCVALPRVLTQGAIVLGCLGYLAWLAWQAFAFALAVVVLGLLGCHWGSARAQRYLHRARSHEDEVYGGVHALVAGAKELALHADRRRAFLQQLAGSVEKVRVERRRGMLIHVAAVSAGGLLFFVVIGGVVFWLGAESPVRSGYALMFLYMMHPMELLLESIPELGRTRVALERIEELGMTAESAAAEAVAATEAKRERFESVRLEGVTHRYRRDGEEGAFVLGPLSLELVPGEVVFVVGGNGSGKTTLAKLLVGLYAAEGGEVLLDGVVQRGARLEAYRQHFSAVFSDFHLFSKLVGLGAGELDGRANELLSALGLSHKVKVEGGSFSTTELSRGQQKRLALLVACLEDRAALVFDEWAADQDPAYKAVFYERVLPWLKSRNKAVVVITHDDRYFHCADRCLTLDAGKLTTRIGRQEPLPPRAAGKVDAAWL
jgi:putative ATP-binding cassette transporter